MKENEIRPGNLMQEYKNLHFNDIEKLLLQKGKFVFVGCPACDQKNTKFLFKKKGFSFVKCNNCETVFVNPRPTFEMLMNFYEESDCFKYWNDKIFPASENARRNSIFKPRAENIVELCTKYKTGKKILMDVGAGFGTFCEEIEKLNIFDGVVAVEPSDRLAETCEKKNLTVIKKPIEEVSFKNVDVITNFELIEHLFDPKIFIAACGKLLNKNGLLILTTPNIKGFDLMVLGDKSNNIVAPNHLNYFNIESLSYLLTKLGFEVLEILTPGKLDAEIVRKKIINKELDISNNPFLKNILIDRWENIGKEFQDFLANNNLSSHLWIVARKM